MNSWLNWQGGNTSRYYGRIYDKEDIHFFKHIRPRFTANESKCLFLKRIPPVMSDTITYQYIAPSALTKAKDQDELFLAKYSEVQKKDSTCFFWGRLSDPYTTARCLITLSNVVQSSFNLSPFEIAKLKDPIVTAGNEKIRFEGFSHCAGVYARVDILPGGL